jgi:hypothetical protein
MIELKDFKKMSFNSEEERVKAIADLEAFVATPGWQFLKKFIELNIAETERQILESELSKEGKYTEEDLEKKMRLFMIKVRDLPLEELNNLKGGENDQDDPDPYARVKN